LTTPTDKYLTNKVFNQCTLKNIELKYNSTFSFIIDNCTIEDLNINNSNMPIAGVFAISECDIGQIEINNCIFRNEFIFIDNIPLHTNQLDFYIFYCTFEKSFAFEDNRLDKTQVTFADSKFKENSHFRNNTVGNILIERCDFDTLKEANFNNFNINNKLDYDKETCRIIKHHLEKNNNKIEANKFHSYELKAKKNQLFTKPKIIEKLDEKTVFLTNEFVSEHGLKWYLPVFWIMLIGFYFSSCYMSNNYISSIHDEFIRVGKYISSFLFIYELTYLTLLKINQHYLKEWNIPYYYNKLYLINRLFYSINFFYAMYVYWIINGINPEPFMSFLNIIDFTHQENISIVAKNLSRIIMIYLLYHLTISMRRDTRR